MPPFNDRRHSGCQHSGFPDGCGSLLRQSPASAAVLLVVSGSATFLSTGSSARQSSGQSSTTRFLITQRARLTLTTLGITTSTSNKVISTCKHGGAFWVHDYHVPLIAGMIRSKIPDGKIGFSFHTAFLRGVPLPGQASRTPRRHVGCEPSGFPEGWVFPAHLATCIAGSGYTIVEGVQLEDHFVNVMECPIGINVDATARKADEVNEWIDIIKIVVTRDQLDNIREA